ncbi:MAG: hypothetical protein LBU08_01385 [Tannerellaceae bacterium]|nr:hypothetical protein [Tannerellaceae bacterium]
MDTVTTHIAPMKRRKDAWSRWCFTAAGSSFSILCLAALGLLFTQGFIIGYIFMIVVGFAMTFGFLWAGTMFIPKNAIL